MARPHGWIAALALVVVVALGASPASASPVDLVDDDVAELDADDGATEGIVGATTEEILDATTDAVADAVGDVGTGVDDPTAPQPTSTSSPGQEHPQAPVVAGTGAARSADDPPPPAPAPSPAPDEHPAAVTGERAGAGALGLHRPPPRSLVRSIGDSATAFGVPVALLVAIGLAAVVHARLVPADRRLASARIDRDLRRFQ